MTKIEKHGTPVVMHKGAEWNFEHFFMYRGARYMRISTGRGDAYYAANVRVGQ